MFEAALSFFKMILFLQVGEQKLFANVVLLFSCIKVYFYILTAIFPDIVLTAVPTIPTLLSSGFNSH